MKKKLFIVSLVLFLLVGCSGKSENATESSGGNTTEAADNKVTLDDLAMTEYKYDSGFGSTIYLISVKNNSSQTFNLTVNATAYDASNAMLGAADGSIDVIGPGEESCMFLYFSEVTGIDHISYKDNVQYSTDIYYQPVIANLSVQQAVNGNVLVLAVTNNGEVAAEFVEAYAVFLDANNTPLYISSTYIMDANNVIAPGATQSAQIEYYNFDDATFDHVNWYLTGRAEK